MSSYIQKFAALSDISPPKWLPNSVQSEVLMGSIAYGVAQPDSDWDIYGFCIPPKDMVFPHLRGEIPGFGRQQQRFDQYQQHHVQVADTEYDFTIYSIIKYFQLCMDNNPNMIDSLFVPRDCVLYTTQVGEIVRDARKLFLHKGSWHKFRGYAFSQLSRLKGKSKESKRWPSIQKHGYDIKFAYHVVRLINEVEQILVEGDIDLRKDNAMLKSIRAGEWTEQRVRDWFATKEKDLGSLYISSKLQHKPDEEAIKELLLSCLEQHYGSLAAIHPQFQSEALMNELEVLVRKYQSCGDSRSTPYCKETTNVSKHIRQ